ncbi:hypothetical protein GH721_16250 [Kriegella sp. EG-1]|nr:hypothetical protein [Flavobacteriaceae bacterium EG-1]
MKKTRNIFKTTIKNKIVQDCNATEIEFPHIEIDDFPELGDEAKVNGKDAEGEFIMPDGSVWEFYKGVLITITDPEPMYENQAKTRNVFKPTKRL